LLAADVPTPNARFTAEWAMDYCAPCVWFWADSKQAVSFADADRFAVEAEL